MSKEFFCLHQPVDQAPDLPGLKPHDPKRGVRVVKDVLPVGRWKSPRVSEPWTVTLSTLNQIAADYDSMKSNGRVSKLYWGNYRPDARDQHDVSPRDEIGEIDQAIVHGGKLWVACYCSDAAEAAKLKRQQVSIGVKDDFEHGDERYELALMHVVVCDHAVVTGQGPFYTMAVDSDSDPEAKGDSMLFKKLKEKFGLGDDVTEDNIDAAIEAKLKPAPDAKPTEVSDDGKNLAAVVKEQHKLIIAQGEQIKTLANNVTKLVAKEETSAKDAYSAKLDKLFKEGRINKAKKDQLTELGAPNQYNLSLLGLFDDIKTLANDGSRVQTFADAGDDGFHGTKETDAQRNERLKAGGMEPLRVL